MYLKYFRLDLMAGVVLALLVATTSAAAIVPVDMTGGVTPTDVANSLVASGGGITISNVIFTGDLQAGGLFSNGTAAVGFDDGIILSSGRVLDVVGPNNNDGLSTGFFGPGDADLNALIPGYTTNDAAILEFDFVPVGDQVTFQYVFTSEEYNEYVNSTFNDVFGFFINGVNYALLPDGVTPVSINNVNGGNPYGSGGANPAFFVNNDVSDGGGSIDIQADGLTVLLTLNAPVNPGVTNHMKLAIADAGDFILDSWVFLKSGSLQIAENCDNGIDDDGDGLIDNDDPDCQVCGDGDLDPGEECDDGNIADGDGCSALCVIEAGPPVCSGAFASPGVLWSPNHKMVEIALKGVTDPDGDLTSIVVTSIMQDEELLGISSGYTTPDAQLSPLAVRAERDGGGNGRVYHIDFTATDSLDNSCIGTVTICVPHDQRPGGGCVDEGALFSSTYLP